ncbi:MAG: alpha/beta hydrolase [Aequorivita sp.]
MIFKFQNKSIFYETYGEGPAMLLVHGFLESSNMWKPFLEELSKKNIVVMLDLPGHGSSDVLAETHSMELMAETIHALLEYLNIETITLVGHSMGGYISLAFVEKYPEKVEKLVLINSTPLADSEEGKRNRDRALKVIDQTPKAYISMAIGNLFAEESRDKFSDEIENQKTEAYSFPLEGIKAAIRGMRDRKNRTEVLKNFPREKFILLAAEDPIMPIAENTHLAKETNTFVKIVSGGHMSSIEKRPEVEEFLHFVG